MYMSLGLQYLGRWDHNAYVLSTYMYMSFGLQYLGRWDHNAKVAIRTLREDPRDSTVEGVSGMRLLLSDDSTAL